MINLDDLKKQHIAGYTLPQAFYVHPASFEQDYEKIIRGTWHLAGHVSRLTEPGQYFIARIAEKQLIVVRQKDGHIKAFHNVCRHRGSLICLNEEGKQQRLVCPYHAWTYGLDGKLLAAADMPQGFKRKDHGLKSCTVHVEEGLIFIALDESAGDFRQIHGDYIDFLKPHMLTDTKVAQRIVYPTAANWKLVYENFTECYHCAPSHPEYVSIHSKQKIRAYGAGAGSGTTAEIEKFEPEWTTWKQKAEAIGLRTDSIVDRDLLGAYWRQAGRFPIKENNDTESRDGRLLAPPLSPYVGTDGGQTGVAFSPFYTVIVNTDYAVLFRFTPISVLETEVELTWLVNKDAQEGKDYDLDELVWLWDVTNRQDGEIVTNNQKGVLSREYEPGPYSIMEARAAEFVTWYLNKLAA